MVRNGRTKTGARISLREWGHRVRSRGPRWTLLWRPLDRGTAPWDPSLRVRCAEGGVFFRGGELLASVRVTSQEWKSLIKRSKPLVTPFEGLQAG
jgi:hypothetical protein